MKKVLLIVFFTSVVVGGFILLGLYSVMPDFQTSSYAEDKLVFTNHRDTLYLKKRIDGNKEIIAISTSSDLKFDPDSSSMFIYDVSSTSLFYKQTADSLIIYTNALSEIPAKFTSRVKISQIELSNPEMMDLMDNKYYMKMGLKKLD
ncbi:hypothetical protein SAMN05421820_10450 [Pedobacter steynii]|uniref:Uncharacterized protein n=1 Tax=Pedobacter steynii TaxID=430522 RepID=A0A1G9U3W1_9SPHI|nr:hypothetical protein [Pedobacter steynii]NQX40646.1 hypothetical protein [Pedobacter steynii]SDM54571.1 hypothetical protein SAMN05421820_10450 [Pedobacter steynii]